MTDSAAFADLKVLQQEHDKAAAEANQAKKDLDAALERWYTARNHVKALAYAVTLGSERLAVVPKKATS